MTALVAVLLLLSGEAGTPGGPDAGVRTPAASRSAEDQEVIDNLDLLEQLADSEALEMALDLEGDSSRPDAH